MTATLSPSAVNDVLSITVGSRTALFGASDAAVQITDDSTGELLLDLDWRDLERAAEGSGPTYATYADGETRFFSSDGALIMAISDTEAFRAFEEQAERYQAGIDHTLLVRSGDAWYEAELPELDGATPERLGVGGDEVLLGVIRYGDGDPEEVSVNEIRLLLGSLATAPAE